ncbi:hypothetical protein SPRG_17326 [Saprolegnia parasitica CBS 223.65]|uniref:Uncharacterized protein n=1 Tax=Saprolegnia parasitica (strain CBS 223.65) TaxID=695850 RepID=A0A067BRH2_SAPPC|nr:hypothetical protein SPRG_17326 [Saprolegnia parasitica CBS 223.65]KDO17242.1 hypothetical protein SPRG_17326 [Saprolegnia parasitica CBS 223.65]|eukprot:XP_012212048.1 hypothetical protein SPRG_17326 [Saprolegnia parasitica CBS 223.65]
MRWKASSFVPAIGYELSSFFHASATHWNGLELVGYLGGLSFAAATSLLLYQVLHPETNQKTK